MSNEDLLIITADHGCDPCVEGTEKKKKKVPVILYDKSNTGGDLGTLTGFDNVANFIKDWIF